MTSAAEIVAAAEGLRPLIEANADWSEQHRRQAPAVAEALAEAGMHRLAVSASVGGLGCDPVTMIKAIERVAAADGSAGWTMMIGLESLGVASGYLDTDVITEILAAKPATVMASAANPVGRAVPVDGGYQVSGRWPFASGVHNADWWWGSCILEDGIERHPRIAIQALVPADHVQVVDTWNVAGLAGSGSHESEVIDCFVPEAHTFDVWGGQPNVDDPLFRMPLLTRFAFNKVGVATGIARAALDSFTELAATKRPRGERSALAERPRAQQAIARAEALLGSGRAWVFEVVEELWAEALAGRTITQELHAMVRLSCSHAVQSGVEAVELVHSAAGSTANFHSSPLARQFRDVHVVPQQITVAPHMIDTAGRVLLGLEPGIPTF